MRAVSTIRRFPATTFTIALLALAGCETATVAEVETPAGPDTPIDAAALISSATVGGDGKNEL
ncbi:hypothetical protein [Primorskyibacter sp. S187A]|uniref:hypothetical protein n=1 Tax=Primorskyibacter sp. S187A TaxID=3415130 RepID=UPI003C7D3617